MMRAATSTSAASGSVTAIRCTVPFHGGTAREANSSIEWARIEPQRGVIDADALAQYRRILEACHARAILPVVTLHHFTLPLWVADLGGFEYPEIASLMGAYATVVGDALGDLIGIACTVNEPNIVALMGYLIAAFPPAQSDWERFSNVNVAMRSCHVAMRDALRGLLVSEL